MSIKWMLPYAPVPAVTAEKLPVSRTPGADPFAGSGRMKT